MLTNRLKNPRRRDPRRNTDRERAIAVTVNDLHMICNPPRPCLKDRYNTHLFHTERQKHMGKDTHSQANTLSVMTLRTLHEKRTRGTVSQLVREQLK